MVQEFPRKGSPTATEIEALLATLIEKRGAGFPSDVAGVERYVIDPVLAICGWDTACPQQVSSIQPESFGLQRGWRGLHLHDADGLPAVTFWFRAGDMENSAKQRGLRKIERIWQRQADRMAPLQVVTDGSVWDFRATSRNGAIRPSARMHVFDESSSVAAALLAKFLRRDAVLSGEAASHAATRAVLEMTEAEIQAETAQGWQLFLADLAEGGNQRLLAKLREAVQERSGCEFGTERFLAFLGKLALPQGSRKIVHRRKRQAKPMKLFLQGREEPCRHWYEVAVAVAGSLHDACADAGMFREKVRAAAQDGLQMKIQEGERGLGNPRHVAADFYIHGTASSEAVWSSAQALARQLPRPDEKPLAASDLRVTLSDERILSLGDALVVPDDDAAAPATRSSRKPRKDPGAIPR